METNYNRATSWFTFNDQVSIFRNTFKKIIEFLGGINSSKSESQNTANGLTNIEANATDEATNTKKYQIILSFIFIT